MPSAALRHRHTTHRVNEASARRCAGLSWIGVHRHDWPLTSRIGTIDTNTSIPPSWKLEAVPSGMALRLYGDWTAQSEAIPAFAVTDLTLPGGGSLYLDAGGVGRWDSGLIAFLWDVERVAAAGGVATDMHGLPTAARTLVGLLASEPTPAEPPRRAGLPHLARLGEASLRTIAEVGIMTLLLTATAQGAARALAGRARMRAVDLLGNISSAGPSALVIVSVVNFLIGAILAFVGAVQLRKFAADIYVADLVGLALVREMAAVMTAIIMAGRTGGAYAARIATMQGNEEIDALTVIGIPVSDYVVLPAILALVFTMPLLYLYGCLVGIFGGFVVSSAMLNITGAGFLNEATAAVGLDQFVFGFVKSIAFAVLIGVASCRIGLKAGRSAADVGSAATTAVVTGIVGVIALDAVFAILANMIDL